MKLRHRVSTSTLKYIPGAGHVGFQRYPWYVSTDGWGHVWLPVVYP